MTTSAILDFIASKTGEQVPDDKEKVAGFVRRVTKNAQAHVWKELETNQDAFSYLQKAIKAIKSKARVPMPDDFGRPAQPVPEPTAEEKAVAEEKQKQKTIKKLEKLEQKTEEKEQEVEGDQEVTEAEVLPNAFKCKPSYDTVVVKSILEFFEQGMWVLPPFQRKFIWKKEMRQAFLVSLMEGVTIPDIALAVDPDDGTNETAIIDGCQRINTLKLFHDGLETLNGLTFDKLPKDMQKKFLMTVLPISTSTAARKYWPVIFRRRNKGGAPLNSIEIRRATYEHELFGVLTSIADNNAIWQTLFGKNVRYKGTNVLFRAKGMHDSYKEYKKPIEPFLDSYCENLHEMTDDGTLDLKKLAVDLDKIFRASNNVIGKYAFKISEGNQPNAGLIDCMIHAGLTVIENKADVTDNQLGEILKDVRRRLLEGEQGYEALTKDTSGRENVVTRMDLASQYALERLS